MRLEMTSGPLAGAREVADLSGRFRGLAGSERRRLWDCGSEGEWRGGINGRPEGRDGRGGGKLERTEVEAMGDLESWRMDLGPSGSVASSQSLEGMAERAQKRAGGGWHADNGGVCRRLQMGNGNARVEEGRRAQRAAAKRIEARQGLQDGAGEYAAGRFLQRSLAPKDEWDGGTDGTRGRVDEWTVDELYELDELDELERIGRMRRMSYGRRIS
jgi:hypothetical protein